MSLRIPAQLLAEIQRHAEQQYPEEGAGLILGLLDGEDRTARSVLPVNNTFEAEQRGRRYLIDPMAILRAEEEAQRKGSNVLGVYHSHPDHPPTPSKFDLEWAVPWYIYLITAVRQGIAEQTRAWRLQEDHAQMIEEQLTIEQEAK
ncbi:MAG: M67 family metallopeptidase [Anaerolineales bacterium]